MEIIEVKNKEKLVCISVNGKGSKKIIKAIDTLEDAGIIKKLNEEITSKGRTKIFYFIEKRKGNMPPDCEVIPYNLLEKSVPGFKDSNEILEQL